MNGGIVNTYNEVRDCYRVLETYFTRESSIPMSHNEVPRHIDYVVAHYLLEKGHAEWLVKNDVSDFNSYQIGGISEMVLSEFAFEEREFDNREGKFKIYEHEKNGAKFFFAKPVEVERR
jgi:hypothetical protein